MSNRYEGCPSRKPQLRCRHLKAIVTAHNCPDRYPDIEASIQAIIFLATPHGGSRAANIGLSLSNIATLAFQRPSKQLLQALKVESELLSDLSKGFLAVHKSFHIVSFYERRKTSMLNTLVHDVRCCSNIANLATRLSTRRHPGWASRMK